MKFVIAPSSKFRWYTGLRALVKESRWSSHLLKNRAFCSQKFDLTYAEDAPQHDGRQGCFLSADIMSPGRLEGSDERIIAEDGKVVAFLA